jgi:hypothetical protein
MNNNKLPLEEIDVHEILVQELTGYLNKMLSWLESWVSLRIEEKLLVSEEEQAFSRR